MKNLLLASVAVLTLSVAVPAFAQDVVVGVEPQTTDADTNALVGGGAGGAVGATIGAVVGGPIGAVIGGFAGATLGGAAGIQASSVEFATANPVETIYFADRADVGYVLPASVTIYPIAGDADYGYVYANDRVWIVDLATRELVQSPGYLVPQTSAEYIVANPVDPIKLSGDVGVGFVVPADVALTPVPNSTYSYVYVNDRPALVDTQTRVIVQLN